MQELKHISELSQQDQEILAKARVSFTQAKSAKEMSENFTKSGKELAEPVLTANRVECVTFGDGYRIYRRPEERTTYAEKALKEAMLAVGVPAERINAILSVAASKSEFVKVYGQESRANSTGK